MVWALRSLPTRFPVNAGGAIQSGSTGTSALISANPANGCSRENFSRANGPGSSCKTSCRCGNQRAEGVRNISRPPPSKGRLPSRSPRLSQEIAKITDQMLQDEELASSSEEPAQAASLRSLVGRFRYRNWVNVLPVRAKRSLQYRGSGYHASHADSHIIPAIKSAK